MYQIDVATAATALPTPAAPGTEGFFTDGNPASGLPATIVDADFMNMLMMELINLVEAGGLTPSKTTYNQVLLAIKNVQQGGQSSYAQDTSTSANTITLALTPAVTAYVDGMPIRFKAANNNTGATQINWGGGAVPLQSAAGALQGGEIVAGQPYVAVYIASLAAAVLVGQGGGAVPVGAATKSYHAAQLGQINALPGGLKSLGAAFASNAMTVTYAGGTLDFPSTIQNGTPARLTVSSNQITAPSGASLGVPNGQPGQIVLLEAYNGGSPVACLVNMVGGVDLSETNLISPTTISSGATANNVIYSASAVAANSPYRVIGVVDVPAQTTAGVYATGTPTAFGTGGMAYAAMQSFGFGQKWQDVTASRALNTIYYNTTPRPIALGANVSSTSTSSLTINVAGTNYNFGTIPAGGSTTGVIPVPVGAPYSVTGGTSLSQWFEMH